MISSTGSIIVPLSAADVAIANVQDNQVYEALTSTSLPSTTVKKTHYMIADPRYDDQRLYELSTSLNFQLVCPIRSCRTTRKKDFNWLISMNRH